MDNRELVDAIIDAVKKWVTENPPGVVVYAQWEGVDPLDADLSEISFADGSSITGIPKLAHVTGLSSGDIVMCINQGGRLPLTIIGVPVGDVTVYGV